MAFLRKTNERLLKISSLIFKMASVKEAMFHNEVKTKFNHVSSDAIRERLMLHCPLLGYSVPTFTTLNTSPSLIDIPLSYHVLP